VASVLVMHHSWRDPAISSRELSAREDRLVRACVPDLQAFSSFEPRDQSQTAVLFLEHADSGAVLGAWTVAGALRLADMLGDTMPDVASSIRASY
jgi:hypothetical protein